MSYKDIVQKYDLDVSVVDLQDLEEAQRIDAEYYKPKYLQEESTISKLLKKDIGDFAYVTDGQHGYHEEDIDSEIRFLTAKNAKNWFADGENVIRVAWWVDEKNKRSSLQTNDLILSTRGTVGLCAIVSEEILPAQIDQDVARICINKNTDISPEFLLAYLNSSFGQDWMKRNTAGNVQQGLSLDKVRKISIPALPKSFQNKVSVIVNEAFQTLEQSKQSYAAAQTLLLQELGLVNWKPTENTITERELIECLRADRLTPSTGNRSMTSWRGKLKKYRIKHWEKFFQLDEVILSIQTITQRIGRERLIFGLKNYL